MMTMNNLEIRIIIRAAAAPASRARAALGLCRTVDDDACV